MDMKNRSHRITTSSQPVYISQFNRDHRFFIMNRFQMTNDRGVFLLIIPSRLAGGNLPIKTVTIHWLTRNPTTKPKRTPLWSVFTVEVIQQLPGPERPKRQNYISRLCTTWSCHFLTGTIRIIAYLVLLHSEMPTSKAKHALWIANSHEFGAVWDDYCSCFRDFPILTILTPRKR